MFSLHAIQRAFDAHRTLSQHMGVDHRRPHVGVAQQFLHRSDIAACLEWAISKSVWNARDAFTDIARWLRYDCFACCSRPLRGYLAKRHQ